MDVWTQYLKYQNDVIYNDTDSGLRVLCTGLSGTFYFYGGETKAMRLAIARCFEQFQALFSAQLEWVRPCEDVSRRSVKIGSKKKIPTIREYVEAMDPNDELDWEISGGRSEHEASDCYIRTLVVRHWMTTGTEPPMSWLNFAMPVEAVYGPEGNPQLFTDFIRFCCEQLRPWLGIAGLASLLPALSDESLAEEFDVQQRYFGLDVVSEGYMLSLYLRASSLKGANWLTLFSEDFPVTITREQWQTLRTTPGIQVWKTGQTYVLQAGDQPTLGPITDGIPPLYKVVSDIIKPMRLTPMPSFHIGSMTGEIRFNGRTTELWSQRFDAPGIWPPYPDQIEFYEVDTAVDEYAAQPAVAPAQQPPAAPPRLTVLRADPGQPCPQEGDWFSPFVKNKVHVKKGETMPGPEIAELGRVTWYLRLPD